MTAGTEIPYGLGLAYTVAVAVQRLDIVAVAMQSYPGIQLIEVQGHTAKRGDDAYNLELSDRRAAAVVAYHVDEGVDPKRLTSQGTARPTRSIAATTRRPGRQTGGSHS